MRYKHKKTPIRKRQPSIYYKTEMVKKGKKILWRAVEMPSKLVLKESFFEEDVKKLVKFQNKHKVWKPNGGIPKLLWTRV